ncbi:MULTISPECIES: acetolactate synthase small subunit [Thermoactinomyces]|jgi:acetolactate synthase I/III small subunit|uniref:Acetolactate synthase small subunit n=1 Tax=Thermoactinomyces daqus TaxID=1329516 RepID=A0A7W1X7J1_9BACL|nr:MULTISPECIES: acetolactate synthase small subunit [Thermoactinomyces]MBA4541547.1 acetolactate synthase small subunit [Thermoactinomyces daqus]MBH8597543.1 acetolactate synthase small subunit [Thermoactinomyces sp. CICC 10523]MBH8603884.1 acetolactate synthase small subunit [Thermoactinomyces sp. CICC 10522]MBH8606583.1 acetolactate synthase small subunit [Thermoactinomyces sp. CICC 10521]
MRHILSVLVNNQPRVLARVASLIGQRNYNIESISVGESEKEGLSRMIIITGGDHQTLEQVRKQLEKLIDVIKVEHLEKEKTVERELLLIKVEATSAVRAEIFGIVEPFRASIVDVSPQSLTIQVTGEPAKLEAMVELLRPYGIIEIARTGAIALERGLNKVKATV